MQYTSLRNLEYWLGQIWHLNKKDCVIIFEVYKDGVTVNDISGGCRRKSVQYVGAQGLCHDVIPYQDFVQGLCLIPYITRKGNLKDLFDMQYYPCFNISEGFYLSSEEEAYKEFDKYVDRGEEGIIGREPQGIWQAGKKNEFAWKIKEKISYDLIVIGLEEGKGKYEGTTGKIVCKFRKYGKVDGEYCEVKCSGMTDDQRHSWWVANDLIIGKIVKVDAMTFSKNGLLREPRFKEMRADKLEADFI
jgi:DNA ligase-1